jgi:hypothetical protein
VIRGEGWSVRGADERCVEMVNIASWLLFHVLDLLQSICPGYVRKSAARLVRIRWWLVAQV